MRISDWSSDVCSSDLGDPRAVGSQVPAFRLAEAAHGLPRGCPAVLGPLAERHRERRRERSAGGCLPCRRAAAGAPSRARCRPLGRHRPLGRRSEEHTSELQSLMRISYAVFCLKKKKTKQIKKTTKDCAELSPNKIQDDTQCLPQHPNQLIITHHILRMKDTKLSRQVQYNCINY